jgi:hypothetical protein
LYIESTTDRFYYDYKSALSVVVVLGDTSDLLASPKCS